MPSHQSAVSTLIREVLADPDLAHDEVFRRLLQAGLQDLVDAEAAAVIGAQRYERTPERTNRRNGKRLKTVATTAGEVELAIPKLRTGSFFPSLLHPRRRVDKALYAVICSAWIEGVSTRKVDDLVKALGNESGISRSTVSRICKDIDEGVKEFLARSLDHTWFPYLFVDATYLDVRVGHRVVCRALVVATGVSAQSRREILGMALGDAETVDFRVVLVLRSLRERGLKVPSPEDPTGVVLVTSDAHAGIRAAVRAILPGASWQRCRVHFARNITSRLGSARPQPVHALVSTTSPPPTRGPPGPPRREEEGKDDHAPRRKTTCQTNGRRRSRADRDRPRARYQPQHRRLAAAARPEQSFYFAVLQVQTEIAHNGIAENFKTHVFKIEHHLLHGINKISKGLVIRYSNSDTNTITNTT